MVGRKRDLEGASNREEDRSAAIAVIVDFELDVCRIIGVERIKIANDEGETEEKKEKQSI